MARSRHPTLLDVLQAVSDVTVSAQETLAAVVPLIHRDQVRLCAGAVRAMPARLAETDVAA
jgi:hypothetical protein